MRRQTFSRPSLLRLVVSLWWDSGRWQWNIEVRHNRTEMGVNHDLTRRTTAGIHCSKGSGVTRTALGTSFMDQIERLGIREASDEI